MSKIEKIFIPDLGPDKDVDLIDVMVSVGDKVEVEDGLITLETEKASMDVPTTFGGVVKEIFVKVGDKVNSGDLIASIEIEDEEIGETNIEEPTNTNTEIEVKEEITQPTQEKVNSVKIDTQKVEIVVEEVFIPDLGPDKDVDLIDIMMEVGEVIAMDYGLVTLETEKASMDVPAPFGGKVLDIFVKVGDKVNSGDKICSMEKTIVIESKSETPKEEVKVIENVVESKKEATLQDVAVSSSRNTSVLSQKNSIIYASPSVRKVAREFGVDLSYVKGSGKKNRILKEDIKSYVKEQLNKPVGGGSGLGFNLPELKDIDFTKFGEIEEVELNRIQKISGPSLHRNWVSMPHVTQFDEADITKLEKFRKEQNAVLEDIKLSPLVFVVKAVAKALELHPKFNSSLNKDGTSLIMKKYFNIGIAVDTPNGLVVPVLKNVNEKGFKEIAIEMGELSVKAREGKLKNTDMEGACFTISSLGGIGGTKFTPIINAPEVAILGLSKAEIKPKWNGENFVPRLVLPLSLSYDHKVIDGADGARFTTTLSKLLADIRLLNL